MKSVLQVLKDLFQNFPLIIRLANYDLKSRYQVHYLGMLWQFINPAIQVLIYWFVFGIGFRAGEPIGDTPYFVWLLIGLIPWFFISPSLVQGSNSIYSRINLVSKMKFPVSILPTIVITSNVVNFLIMLVILFIVLAILNLFPSIYLIQLPYYLLCIFVFLYSFTLLGATISAIIRDFQLALQSVVRMLFFLTPILWDVNTLSPTLQGIIKINPLVYIIQGFRNTLLGESWFFEDIGYTLYFWIFTFLLLLVGAVIHLNFKDKFVDYL